MGEIGAFGLALNITGILIPCLFIIIFLNEDPIQWFKIQIEIWCILINLILIPINLLNLMEDDF